MARSLLRSNARAAARAAELKVSAAQLQAASEETTALSAKVGRCVEIAEQRQGDYARAAFTFNTIVRDLKARQRSLNSTAALRDAGIVASVVGITAHSRATPSLWALATRTAITRRPRQPLRLHHLGSQL